MYELFTLFKLRYQCDTEYFESYIERKFIMSSKFDDFLQEQLQDPEIRKEYEALQSKYTVIQSEIDTAQKSGMPPKELVSLERISE